LRFESWWGQVSWVSFYIFFFTLGLFLTLVSLNFPLHLISLDIFHKLNNFHVSVRLS
ncbi:hypothetical protein L9F63_010670, partial [Diploptera punctata]